MLIFDVVVLLSTGLNTNVEGRMTLLLSELSSSYMQSVSVLASIESHVLFNFFAVLNGSTEKYDEKVVEAAKTSV